jgi:hypothetical protein
MGASRGALAPPNLDSLAQQLFPAQRTDGIMAIMALPAVGIPFQPRTILANLLNLPIEADSTHIPKIHQRYLEIYFSTS